MSGIVGTPVHRLTLLLPFCGILSATTRNIQKHSVVYSVFQPDLVGAFAAESQHRENRLGRTSVRLSVRAADSITGPLVAATGCVRGV